MKPVLTVLVIISYGILCMAQGDGKEVKVTIAEHKFKAEASIQFRKRMPKRKLTRVYMYKNYRVKKELNFRTKGKSTKLA